MLKKTDNFGGNDEVNNRDDFRIDAEGDKRGDFRGG